MKIALATLMVMALATTSGAQQSSSRSAPGDNAFAMKAAGANMAEVELGKLALQKSMRDEVKTFAQQMVDDHSKALDELKGLAGSKNITLPSDLDAEHKMLSERLSKLSGAAFDRAYMEAMVDGHRKVAAAVRTESQSGSDPELKAWATKTLPKVEAHLKHAETVNRGVQSGSATH